MEITVEKFRKISSLNVEDATIIKNIKRAELMIKVLIPKIEENKLLEVQKEKLETAIILQAEYLMFFGENASIGNFSDSFSIGSFSMGNSKSNQNININRYSENAIDILYSSGLLYERVRLI